MLIVPREASAQAVRGEAALSTTGGYARLVLKMAEPVDAQVRVSGNVLTIFFKRPVDIPVDRISATDYIGAARRDPDGRALRFALARKLKVNSIVAAERMFVDLLPETWTGDPPGLPQEVVEDLARRAREAERLARKEAELAVLRKVTPVRVRIAQQPTFTRYVFELQDLIGVTADRGKDRLTLKFARPLKFDLADAKLASPPAVGSIDSSLDLEASEVRFGFSGPVDVRSFREDMFYVVDVSALDGKPTVRGDVPLPIAPVAPTGPLAGVEPPQTVPARQTSPNSPPAPVASQVAPQTPTRQQPAAVMPNVGNEPTPPVVAMPAAAPLPAAADETPKLAEAPKSLDVPKPLEAPKAVEAAKPTPASSRAVAAELRRHGDSIRVAFPFGVPTPAAVFQRADTLWLVFETTAKLDLSALANEPSRTVRSASVSNVGSAQVVHLKLERPRLTSVAAEGATWSIALGDAVADPTRALVIGRNIVGPSRTSITIPFEEPRTVHRLRDPDIGDTLLVVTAVGPARGFVRSQDFVDFRALASAHGVAVEPHADDLEATLATDKIEIGRPGGLTLSESPELGRRVSITRSVTFDGPLWEFDRKAKYTEREHELITGAAGAPPAKRAASRLDLARFYLARDMFVEAKAVLDVAIQDDRPNADNPTALVLRAFANIMLDRADVALRDLANPLVGNQHDAQLWRALALVRQSKWTEAREHFRDADATLANLPVDVQRIALKDSLRAAIEVGDFAGAASRLNDLETVGTTPELEAQVAVLTGRVAEGLGRGSEALAAYRSAAGSADRPAAAQGRLREIVLRYGLGDAKNAQVVNDLEILTTAWRGGETENEALQLLAKLYTEEQRYRDAFQVMRTALIVHPSSDATRRIHDEAAVTFDSLFLAGKVDALPPIDALSLFYDFRDLTPVGRRGDEMIRRLADRLVAVDLLDQAAELLQHQVDNRLQGAARAQVATKLAVIYLLNHKPNEAQAALRSTRNANISNEVRNQRLLIESRALSDIGRRELALEIISSIEGPEAIRLRADIHWAARQWREAAEQIELVLGERWRNFTPLGGRERADVLRAAIGYALVNDVIGMGRLREKYAAKMAEGPDKRAFEVVQAGIGTNSAEFRDVARTIAAVDTLDSFLHDLQGRYPDMNVLPHATPGQPVAGPPAPPQKPDRESTGSVGPQPAPRLVPSRVSSR